MIFIPGKPMGPLIPLKKKFEIKFIIFFIKKQFTHLFPRGPSEPACPGAPLGPLAPASPFSPPSPLNFKNH